ncbi:regulatory-associated protein of mTOR-like [Paramacrobiotus metropolitanus]|uniref:regulatory-associated protein of mTOR-like n=1 Tax=Paramacrobiotus metropolitanus TaxID=2943436 RepID=UPI0024459C3F|nr:regulatory-associated protein of mTOR-like [Paramacrobiotus metropolitanus]
MINGNHDLQPVTAGVGQPAQMINGMLPDFPIITMAPNGPFLIPGGIPVSLHPPPVDFSCTPSSESAIQKRINLLVNEGQTDPTDWHTPLAFTQLRHTEPIEGYENSVESWRVKDRMKTVSVALVLCLNVGVDPPDVFKPNPCARQECWLDPSALGSQKAVETIGNALQKQYERWQPRARYKQSLDPTIEDVKKLCISSRKSSKDERILFHYNGHGVPKPTANGEIWVFNKNYTQYLPLSVFDLQTWMGVPSIYVYDCCNAGTIVQSFLTFADSQEEEYEFQRKSYPDSDEMRETPPQYRQCIHLAACAGGEELPTNPDLPADLFTACLTTPIKMALRWYTLQNKTRLLPEITLDMIDKIPGQMNDRRTMLGELNWIFTAVTDTIAWNSVSRDLFHRLFRQDLLVASLFRNFLLAERVMRSYNCSPISFPNMPHSTAQHSMWETWDFALDACLCQLPAVLEGGQYMPSAFFTEQLTAFQVWLTYGSEERSPPEQLPIVLQVLLSQSHRLRALDLLGRFVDLGPWAVNQALSVGIFPYVLKLLQSSARELRPLLVFIWAKILAVDDTCQGEVIREGAHKYFFDILSDSYLPVEHRTMAAFVISRTVSDNIPGKEIALKDNLIPICEEQILESRGNLRQWVAICLGIFWTKHANSRWAGVRYVVYDKLFPLLHDPVPEVRIAAVFALGTFMGNDEDRSEHANAIDSAIGMQLVNACASDASPLVRMELVGALQWLVLHFEAQFTSIAAQMEEEERSVEQSGINIAAQKDADTTDKRSPENHLTTSQQMRKAAPNVGMHSFGGPVFHGNLFRNVVKVLMNYARDPFPDVTHAAIAVLQVISDRYRQPSLLASISRLDSHDHSQHSSPKSSSDLLDSVPRELETSLRINTVRQVSIESKKSSHEPTQLTYSQKYTRKRGMFDPGPSEDEELDEDHKVKTEAIFTTSFVSWCGKAFALPLMKPREDQDPAAARHFQKEWKYIRNKVLRANCASEIQTAGVARYDVQAFMNRNHEIPIRVQFDLCEPLLYVAGRSHISTWNYEKNFRVASFPNGHSRHNRISDVALLNRHYSPFILVAVDDGTVKVWKNIAFPGERKQEDLVTAWQALPEIISSHRAVGTVIDWEPMSQHLIVGGDAKLLRVWNLESETRIVDIPTRLDSSASSICSDSTSTGIFAAGYQDGSVRLYDRRCPAYDAQVMIFDGHASSVVSTKMPENVLFHKIYSGSADGDVKVWDARVPNQVSSNKTIPGMTAMDVHEKAEVFACGSNGQSLNVYNFLGSQLSSVKYYEGFMGQRIGPVSAVAFHPLRTTLAVGCTDSFVSVYTSALDKKPVRQ